MANYGNIRLAFTSALKVFELDFKDVEQYQDYKSQHEIQPTTLVRVGKKTLKAGDLDKEIESSKEDEKKLIGMADKIDRIEKSISNIEDPEQKENAEKVLAVAKLINDPDASSEEKKDAFADLVDAGLVQKNAGGNKIYVDDQKTGLFYKVFGDKESPKPLQNVAAEYGLEDIPKRSKGGIDKKAMTGAKLFGDKKGEMKIETSDKGVTIDGIDYHKQEIPSMDKMIEIYGSKEEAEKAVRQVEKHNRIIDETAKALSGVGGVETLSAFEDTPPTTSENRTKLRNGTADIIADGFEAQFKEKNMTASQKKIMSELRAVKDIKDPEEYDKKLLEITGSIMMDPFFTTGAADTVEMISYMRELNKDNVVYMPAASNFPLGDIVSMSPEKIDFEKDSPEEIRNKIQLIHVGVEKRSIKKGSGGASASGEKVNLSRFKSINGVSEEEITGDLKLLSDKSELYNQIFEGDTAKAHAKVKELAKKYKFDLEDEAYVTSRDKSVESAIAYVKKKNQDLKDEELRAYYTAYYDLGKTMENVYNETVVEQFFTNEVWGLDKKNKTAKVDRTDGINSIAYLKYEFNVGFGKTGRPSNTVPTRFKNKEVE